MNNNVLRPLIGHGEISSVAVNAVRLVVSIPFDKVVHGVAIHGDGLIIIRDHVDRACAVFAIALLDTVLHHTFNWAILL
jgi:hypothetical protein